MNDISGLLAGSFINNSLAGAVLTNRTQVKVQIVDDELIIAVDLAYSLEHQGFQVVGLARDGESAVRMALSTRPDIMILDVNLSGAIDGIAVAQKIHNKLKTRIILASAYPDRDPRIRKLLREGICSFIQKPFSIEAMCGQIDVEVSQAIQK